MIVELYTTGCEDAECRLYECDNICVERRMENNVETLRVNLYMNTTSGGYILISGYHLTRDGCFDAVRVMNRYGYTVREYRV